MGNIIDGNPSFLLIIDYLILIDVDIDMVSQKKTVQSQSLLTYHHLKRKKNTNNIEFFQLRQPGRGGERGPPLVGRSRDGRQGLLQGARGARPPRPGERPRVGCWELQVPSGFLQGAHTDI